ADEGGEGLQVAGEVACGRCRIGLRESVTDDTIAAKVVTHGPFLLVFMFGGGHNELTFKQCRVGNEIKTIYSIGIVRKEFSVLSQGRPLAFHVDMHMRR